MGSTIERGNFHIKIGENQRLPLEIVGCDRREESKIQLHCTANVHGENTLSRSIFVGRLIHGSGSWQPHPRVGITIYTNDTSPANDLTSGQMSVHARKSGASWQVLTPKTSAIHQPGSHHYPHPVLPAATCSDMGT